MKKQIVLATTLVAALGLLTGCGREKEQGAKEHLKNAKQETKKAAKKAKEMIEGDELSMDSSEKTFESCK